MMLVPVGCFMMGNDAGPDDEKPAHPQCFDKPFWIDQTEVTQTQFTVFHSPTNSSYFMGARRPADSVTWSEASGFCELRGARLPTEAEWEYTARGPDNLLYPWGNVLDADKAVWGDTNQTANVGSILAGKSWVGAVDMMGNVWEWTSSLYGGYPYNKDDEREIEASSTYFRRVLRGGSWNYGNVQTTTRFGGVAEYRYISRGFRCARDYE